MNFKTIILTTMIILLAMSASASLTDGLVAYYLFDEGSGTVAGDSSGNGNNGTLMNGPTWTIERKVGNGVLSFDGANDAVNAGGEFIGASPLTISLWIYPRSYSGSGPFIVDNGKTRLLMNSAETTYRFRSDGASTASVSVGTLNQWVHLAVTRDASGRTSFYKNGVQAGTLNQNSGIPAAGTSNVSIGNNISGTATFDGLLDDVRIYNRVLLSSEINEIYSYAGAGIETLTDIRSPAADSSGGGVNTYYIDYGIGSNSNNGLSKESPWKCHPFMTGAGCGTKPIYTHNSGDRFIFKGGVTWPATAMNLRVAVGGTQGNSDYYGTDETWYINSTFAKPIFDGEKTYTSSLIYITAGHIIVDNLELKGLLIANPTNFGLGTIALYRAPDILINRVHVHGFDLKKVNIAGIQRMGGYSYVTTDAPHGFVAGQQISVAEVSNNSFNGAGNSDERGRNAVVDGSGLDAMHFRYANSGPDTSVLNNTGWASLVYVNSAAGGIIGNYNPQFPDVIVQNSEIDNLGGPMAGTALRMIYVVRNNIVHDIASFVIYTNTAHDNIVYNIDYPRPAFDPDSHTNLLWISWNGENTSMPDGSSGSAYNNWMYDVAPAESIFVVPGYGGGAGTHTIYVYNNVMASRGIHNISAVNSGVPASGLTTNAYIWNNTFVQLGNQSCIRTSKVNPVSEVCAVGGCGNITNLVIQNNHCITNQSVAWEDQGAYDHLVYDRQLVQTVGVANAQGYDFSNQYSPTSGTSGTVDKGILPALPIFSRDFKSVFRPQGAGWDIGAYEYAQVTPQQPPTDTDNDGILDASDRCPKTAASARNFVNIFGCALPLATKFDIRPDFNATDINGLQNLELGISQFGKISYVNKNIRLVKTTSQNEDDRLDIDAGLSISQNKITLNQNNLPQLSASATITLNNIEFTTPKILKDGAECTGCTIQGYDRNTKKLVFTIEGF
ncbi:MAG TPA: LamG domain-containing protein [Candidatus Diapherotrites archaeon]|uniref:LamG domain-containing protein n=1 Tax=Candidatus Iainarchaeum sp. TaxID=3101447 RepID=A0A7J4J1R6_9ARCH|nr:LamG domain-containing protein [Candidatus Diapherotrites archaeon]